MPGYAPGETSRNRSFFTCEVAITGTAHTSLWSSAATSNDLSHGEAHGVSEGIRSIARYGPTSTLRMLLNSLCSAWW